MPKQEHVPHDGDGTLLDSVPEHIKNPAGPDAGLPGHAVGQDRRAGATAGLLSRVRRRVAATGARAGAAIRSAIPRAVPSGRKSRAILAAGTAVLLVTVVAGGLVVRAHQRDARLRAAPGGVLTLADAAREAWHLDLDDVVQPQIVPVGDLAGITAGGRVLGLDPATGTQRWAVEVLEPGEVADGARLRCGPSRRTVGSVAVRTPTPSDPLVCVTEGTSAPEAVVITPGGGVARRALGAADDTGGTAPVYAPLPDGGLAVLARDRTPVDLGGAHVVEDDDGVASVKGAVRSAPGVTVRVEDAATGEVRWGPRTVAFDAALANSSCLMWGEDGPELDVLDELAWSADERLISATACGVVVRLATVDGEPEPDAAPSGRILEPWATDDAELAPVPAGEDVQDVLVRTEDLTLVLLEDGRVEGRDAATGDRRWTSDVLGGDAAAVAGSAAFGAYTDGRSAMLVLDGPSTGGAGQLRLVGIDLDSGELTWDVDQGQPYAQVASIDGHLVQVTGTGITGLATG
ncbi:outer membrane protein assembly factor BamB family protein [Myceligenerans indicum]|uniref:PQQ-binding-like beta-propeller repeat protein n=1 Tax=Myceligenerans indicum TaxID=2593663 RepID=A0ABS1LNK8_9MICO|nr:PQQ-binding-like beta-propeller repeat protein [Myceligenerans indicum]MBL0887817.1 PQQ-binding-like beta-propeller repeat protein [Myceligenerans indicum]